MTAALLRANALALPLRADSVDLIVTSPPYFALRSYADGGEHYDGQIGSEGSPKAFLAALWAVMDECWRVLKPSGSCWVNLGDKYAGSGGHNNAAISTPGNKHTGPGRADRYNQTSDGVRPKSRMLLPHRFAEGCISADYRRSVEAPWFLAAEVTYPQWICRMDAVWSKPNGMPESVTDRVRASHEYWFHLTKSERYFAAIDEIREAYAPGTAQRYAAGYKPENEAYAAGGPTNNGALRHDNGGPSSTNPLGKLPGSVWTVPSEPLTVPDWVGVDHFAAFPTEFPRRIILGWSPTGICTRCGEGRQPIVDKQYELAQATNNPYETQGRMGGVVHFERKTMRTTITGYGCGCPTPDAPTRPAVILDPFGGTGTVAMVARALGRYGISVDLSADYLRLADWRIHDSGHWAKAVERTTGRPCTPDQPLPGQLGLFQ